MEDLSLHKCMSPIKSSVLRTSALWEIRELPGMMLRRMDYPNYHPDMKGWYVQYDPEHISGQDNHPLAYQAWRMLYANFFPTRKEALAAVRSACTYLENCPAEKQPLPF